MEGALGSGTAALLAGGSLLLLGLVLAAAAILSRRALRRDVREILQAVEEIRAGRPGRADLDAGSPLLLVGDAVARLGEDLSRRRADVAGAEDRQKVLLDLVRDHALVALTAEAEIRTFSAGAPALFGWSEEEVRGRPASVLFDEASWRDLLPKLLRRNLRERPVEAAAVLVRKDGTRCRGRVEVRRTEGPGGEPTGFLLVVRDVSAQARLEDDLRESEARYRGVVEHLSEGLFLWQDGRVVYANPALQALCGLSVEPGTPPALRDWVDVRDVLAVDERLAALQSREGERDELRFGLLDASGRPAADVRVRAVSVPLNGRPAVLGLVVDETGERRAEAELRRNEERLDAVLEATADGIVVLADGPAGPVVRVTNRAFLEMFGIREREVLGATEGELLRRLREHGRGAEGIAAFLAAAGGDRRMESVALDEEPPRVLEVLTAPLADRAGILRGRVVAFRDRTDQAALEGSLRAYAEDLARSRAELEDSHTRLTEVNADLERRGRDLDALNAELRKLDRMKSDLLANVSHELQTPLVSIRGYTEMVLRGRLGPVTEEQQKGLSLSLKNIDRLIAMIDGLLTFARIDRGAEPRPAVFPLGPLVEESLRSLGPEMEARRIRAGVEVPPDLEVSADREMVAQVFDNLLRNAIKYNREGGQIRVRAEPEGDRVKVSVSDTGIGIPPQHLERIFERFYRVDEGDGAEAGTGIGLAIVQEIVRKHGGTIGAQSQVGSGTTFHFTLPGAEAPQPHGPPGPPPGMPASDPPPRLVVIRKV